MSMSGGRESRISEEQIVAQLNRYGKSGCPMCNNTGFDVGPATYSRDAADKMVVSAVCSRCGYVITFDADRLPA